MRVAAEVAQRERGVLYAHLVHVQEQRRSLRHAVTLRRRCLALLDTGLLADACEQ